MSNHLLIYSSEPSSIKRSHVHASVNASATTAPADGDLLRRIIKREEIAVSLLYDKYASHLYGLLLRILKEQAEAEDTLQEVFLRVWDKADTYNESLGSPVVWLTRIARNLAIDKLRSKLGHHRKAEDGLEQHAELQADESAASPEHAANQSQQRAYILAALNALPREQRMLIESAYFEGFTQSELAERFQLPLGTVKTRIRTGMMTLRRELEQSGVREKRERYRS